jgi:hypothetical protein
MVVVVSKPKYDLDGAEAKHTPISNHRSREIAYIMMIGNPSTK